MAAARRRAGLGHGTCHELRHTCLTRLREAGMSLEAVQTQAGHRSIESTRIYLHLTNDWLAGEDRRAAELIDANEAAVAEMLATQEAVGRLTPSLRRTRCRRRRPPTGRRSRAAHRHWPPRGPAISGQIATTLVATSVAAAENALRQFGTWLTTHTEVRAVADINRRTVEDYKVWLAAQPGRKPGTTLSANTHRQRLRTIRAFFERIIEWDWADTPPRNPVIAGDLPPRPEPLPKFLDDRDAAKIMAAAEPLATLATRLVVELLARTGLRASELCELAADAVLRIGDGHWLRVPVGKCRRSRGNVASRTRGRVGRGRWSSLQRPTSLRDGEVILEAVGRPVDRDDLAVVQQPVQDGGGEHVVAEHRTPLAEGLVRGADHASSLVAAADELASSPSASRGRSPGRSPPRWHRRLAGRDRRVGPSTPPWRATWGRSSSVRVGC